MNLAPYIRAQYSIIYLLTPEESRAEAVIQKTAVELKKKLVVWSCTEGIFEVVNGKASGKEQIEDPIEALVRIKGSKEAGARAPDADTIYVLRDMNPYLNDARVARHLRDIARDFKQSRKTLIILSPVRKLSPDLERDVTVLEFALPAYDEIKVIFDNLYEGAKSKLGKISDDERERIVQAAMGLTTIEAENALAKSIVEHVNGQKDKKGANSISKLVLKEKALAVKKSGILEYYPATQTAADVGGLENLIEWLNIRKEAFTAKARDFGLPMPRGLILVGIPGCGKSLSAKACSNLWDVPLLKLDLGNVFGGLVGESERNMRTCIQTAEALGSSILWLDELEKAFAGAGGNGSTDGGTTQRVFGTFLTWMQEKTCPCFVVATVNRIDGLPPELLRKGRFDEIFFVGLPTARERQIILNIHIKKYKRDVKNFEKQMSELVSASEGFSGAELEEAVVSGLYAAFYHKRDLTAEDVLKAIKNTNPLAKSRGAELQEMVKWAAENAVNASRVEDKEKASETTTGGRQLDLE
jgi:ATP-dependent 26S proteasome regulatory subunit